MGAIASEITSLTIVYSIVYSDADQRKHQRSASLAFVWRIHRGPVNSPHKWPVTWKMIPFDDVIIKYLRWLKMLYMRWHMPRAIWYIDLLMAITNDSLTTGHSHSYNGSGTLIFRYTQSAFSNMTQFCVHDLGCHINAVQHTGLDRKSA